MQPIRHLHHGGGVDDDSVDDAGDDHDDAVDDDAAVDGTGDGDHDDANDDMYGAISVYQYTMSLHFVQNVL